MLQLITLNSRLLYFDINLGLGKTPLLARCMMTPTRSDVQQISKAKFGTKRFLLVYYIDIKLSCYFRFNILVKRILSLPKTKFEHLDIIRSISLYGQKFKKECVYEHIFSIFIVVLSLKIEISVKFHSFLDLRMS